MDSRLLRLTFLTLLLLAAASMLASCGDDSAKRTSKDGGDAKSASEADVDDGDAALPAPVPAKMQITISNVGSKQPSGAADFSAVPTNLACTRSIPATCRGELVCPAAADAPSWHTGACAYLGVSHRQLFQPVPDGMACTEQYGGPEEATITGEVDGREIEVRLARTDGCQIGRWEQHEPLWGVPAPDEIVPAADCDLPGDLPDDAAVSSDCRVSVLEARPAGDGSKGGTAPGESGESGSEPSPGVIDDPPR